MLFDPTVNVRRVVSRPPFRPIWPNTLNHFPTPAVVSRPSFRPIWPNTLNHFPTPAYREQGVLYGGNALICSTSSQGRQFPCTFITTHGNSHGMMLSAHRVSALPRSFDVNLGAGTFGSTLTMPQQSVPGPSTAPSSSTSPSSFSST